MNYIARRDKTGDIFLIFADSKQDAQNSLYVMHHIEYGETFSIIPIPELSIEPYKVEFSSSQ